MHDDWVYLRSYLAPLVRFLARADVTDLYVNRPNEVWIETLGGAIERHAVEDLGAAVIARLARQIAAFSHQGVNREHPLLSAALPDGSRVQIVAPPATRGPVALAVRKHISADLSIDDYAAAGAFDHTRTDLSDVDASRDRVRAALEVGNIADALRIGIRGRLNILVSGGTSTGKTTFLNALLAEVPAAERLVTIEDTPELKIGHKNHVGMLAVRGALGEAQVSADDLVSASLRMRPDRIVLGELRGIEAYAFLRAINTGHPGSMTTIHADDTNGAVEQLALLVLQGGTRLNRTDIIDYVRRTIGLYVQLDRRSGRRYVSEVVCP